MKRARAVLVSALVFMLAAGGARAQVYSPKVLAKGQIDTSTLAAMAEGIYLKSGAVTPRQKAEAIWRFFLTDGRFVPPGFWYHIAGWAYEEPEGEVLDALKLVNSYGFGLCYHIAPLLQAVYLAGGFEDARVWFLTGHTVTEVYYDGSYHHYDSDMLGYTTVGEGDPRKLPVASVSQIAEDGSIILSKLKAPTVVDSTKVDAPWYPADLREAAIGGLASLFTSREDNWLFTSHRFSQGHGMGFVLRPGERLVRYFQPEAEGVFYLPYKLQGGSFSEFPTEISQYNIRTEDGPRSQKDARRWATGRIEYVPVLTDPTSYYGGPAGVKSANLRLPDPAKRQGYLSRERVALPARPLFEMKSPYVLIDAELSLEADLLEAGQSVGAEVSVDGGLSWEEMGRLGGPFKGRWMARPEAKARSAHGFLTAVSGKYGYLIRLTLSGLGAAEGARVRELQIGSRFQLNPRTLPSLAPGTNEISFEAGPPLRRDVIPVPLGQLTSRAAKIDAAQPVVESGQTLLWPDEGKTGEVIFELSAPDGSALNGFDAGARFLDLRDGLAPDKLTAETRTTVYGAASGTAPARPEASLAWSLSLQDGYTPLWEYSAEFKPRDGKPVTQLLRWPEVDRQVRTLPPGTKKVYVRYRLKGMGLDSPRLAVVSPRPATTGVLEVIHQWLENGQPKEHTERIEDPGKRRAYRIELPAGSSVVNRAVIFYCRPAPR